MANTQDGFKKILKGKKIPLLVLDNKWHQLFSKADTLIPADIRRQEERLNELLRLQGKYNTESKDIKRLKKKLMAEILEYSESLGQSADPRLMKKLEENRRLIQECNEKLDFNLNQLRTIPEEMERINYKLMLFTMEVCYQKIDENAREIEQINEWVNQIRIEMKKKLIRKEEKERNNFDLYSYMHDLFGADILEIMDQNGHKNPAESYLEDVGN